MQENQSITMTDVPCRNPLKYCRLCLTASGDLIMLESYEMLTSSNKLLLQKLFHYMKITFNNEQDYPSAICNNCLDRFNSFHDFRRMVVRNHNAVKTFRRLFGDQYDDESTMIEVIDDSQMVEVKQEFEAEEAKVAEPVNSNYIQPNEEVKEVDVYHLDGELRTVVVKEEKQSPEKSPPVTSEVEKRQGPKSLPVANPNRNISKITVLKRPQGKVLNSEHTEKRAKATVMSGFSVVKCSHCRAVFRNRENLLIHERDDHRNVKSPNKTTPPKVKTITQNRNVSKPVPIASQSPAVQLFKCPHCSSSFIQKTNYEQHIKTCKAAALSKLNPQIVVKRTTPAMNEVIKAAVAKIGKNVQIKSVDVVQVMQEDTEEQRIRCHYCPLTYKTKYFLKKHMLDVHKIDDYENVFYCHVCKLNYSCDEDLQLHNRAIHRFQCKQCLEDYRVCMHAQTSDGRPNENGINKGI